MNGHLILREWKEKAALPLFALAFLVIFVFAALVLAKSGEVLDILTGTILLIFLPMTAVLLGASAFGVEYRDGAWAYLFSRPIKKSTVWFSKFIALTGYLAVILLVYGVVLSRVPGVRERIAEFLISSLSSNSLSLWSLCVALSFSLLVIAFSLSILTDKQFQVIFLSGFVFAGLGAVMGFGLKDVIGFHPYLAFLFPLIGALVVISIGAASLLAFCRADFSQPRAKVKGFLRSFGLCLAVAAVIILAAAWISRWFRGTSYLWVNEVQGRYAYINSNQGFYRYDAEQDKLKRLIRKSVDVWGGHSAGGGKIVWIEESIGGMPGRRHLKQDLWIMNEDGRNRRPLFLTAEAKDPSFSGLYLMDCQISPDGRRVLVQTSDYNNSSSVESTTLWGINADGTGLRSYKTGSPNVDWFVYRSWSADGKYAVFFVTEKLKPEDKRRLKRRVRLYRLSLESGAWDAFPDRAPASWKLQLSPDGRRLGLFVSESADADAPRDILALFEIENFKETDILRIPGGQFIYWDTVGEKVAFLADNKRIGVVSLKEKRIITEKVISEKKRERMRETMCWTAEGRKVILSDYEDSRYVLRVFDDTLKEEKVCPIPQGSTINAFPFVYGLGQKVLVRDEPFERLWVFDLTTEKWRRLF